MLVGPIKINSYRILEQPDLKQDLLVLCVTINNTPLLLIQLASVKVILESPNRHVVKNEYKAIYEIDPKTT